MRAARSGLFLSFLFVSVLSAAPAQAQPQSAQVMDADAPTRPLVHQALESSGDIVRQPGSWTAANQAVAETPNGHADIVQWEAKQQQQSQQAMPMHEQHHPQHGGAK